jgi:hypothetical protein
MGLNVKTTWSILPALIELNPDLHTSKYHFFPAFKINTQLDNVSIIHRKGPRFCARGTESNVIEERPRGTLDVLDIPLAPTTPELTVPSTDHLGLEAYWGRRRYIHGLDWLRISLGISAHFDDLFPSREYSSHRAKD